MEKEKLIDLVRKLFALGDKNRNSSEAEAQLATQKAQELLKQHNIDMAEILVKDGQKTVDIKIDNEIVFTLNRSSMSSWEKRLISIVQFATETKGFFQKDYRDVWGKKITWKVGFIGTEWDRAVAKELYNYLHEKIYKLSKYHYPESMPQQRSFMEGFCYRLMQRVDEMNEEKKEDIDENQKYALMIINKKDAINKYIDDQMKLKTARSGGKAGEFHSSAFKHGTQEANNVDLGTENRIGGSNGHQTRQME